MKRLSFKWNLFLSRQASARAPPVKLSRNCVCRASMAEDDKFKRSNAFAINTINLLEPGKSWPGAYIRPLGTAFVRSQGCAPVKTLTNFLKKKRLKPNASAMTAPPFKRKIKLGDQKENFILFQTQYKNLGRKTFSTSTMTREVTWRTCFQLRTRRC